MYYNIPVFTFKILAIICIIGIATYYIIDTIIYNKLPNRKEGDAILIRIITKNKDEYEDIKYKFGSEFEYFVKNNKCGIKILYIPYQLVEQNKSDEEEKIIKLLQKTNCIFLTTIKTRSEAISENTKYITKFNLGIIHPKYIDIIEKVFQNELNLLGMPITRIEYTNEEKLHILEFTAQKISFIEDILEKEPQKNMLRFALILLYLQLNHEKIAKEIMKEYLEYKGCMQIEENIINQLKSIYNNDIINKIIEA